MRTLIVVLSLGCASTVLAQETPPPAPTCFSVIDAKPGVPPDAPILVNSCTGQTYLLSASRRGNRRSYEWRPIARVESGTEAQRTITAAPAVVSKTRTPAGCFSYSGRTFCP